MMERVRISDRTLKQTGKKLPLSFREKIELCRLIDRLEVDTIELPGIENPKVDFLLIKSIASAVRNAEIAVPVRMNADSVAKTWNALPEAPSARLQVCAPVSSVQMEYLFHLKPAAMASLIVETIRECRTYTERVEFIAEDAFRSDKSFLIPLIKAAVEAGAAIVTLQEAAGCSLPEEMRRELEDIMQQLGPMEGVSFGIDCSDELSLADACAIEALRCGIREIKAATFPIGCVSLPDAVRILALKGEKMGVSCSVRREEIRRVTAQIDNICRANIVSAFPPLNGLSDQNNAPELDFHDSKESILRSMEQLGYTLSQEDQDRVYQAFLNVAEKKGSISLKELDALIAAEAMQVPSAYQVVRFVVNSGNEIGAMAHMKLLFHGQALEGISSGDGVIDASFLALEKAVGRHFELDDFQIQAITEGREAMGETIVRLRSQGKLYSGRGISTDIVGASIMAYVNALNKIVYEEEVE